MFKLKILALFTIFSFACQTPASQNQSSKKKSQKKRNQSSEKIVGNNEANSLSKGWDEGLLEYGDKERSRQSLDLH